MTVNTSVPLNNFEVVLARPKTNRADSLLFVAVCCYWLSQSFLIPILQIGPWPAWPTLADFAIFGMMPFALLSHRTGAASQWLTRLLIFLWTICCASFVVATLIYGIQDSGFALGVAQLIRLVQVIIAALTTAKLRLTLNRITILGIISASLLFFTAAGVLLTSFIPAVTAPASLLFSPLPEVSGPWSSYAIGRLPGVGFVGYNHAYSAMQLLLCAGLTVSIKNLSSRWRLVIWIVLLISTLASSSRAGFLCALLLMVSYELKQSKVVIFAIAAACVLFGAYALGSGNFSEYLERQASSANSFNEDGLAGRTVIWNEHVKYFVREPLAILLGSGFGYASRVSDKNAHMLYLHIMTEMGLIGLMAFLAFSWKILDGLKPSRAMYVTFIALLLSGLTQETFYPVLAFPHFLAFFFSAAIAARRIAVARTLSVIFPSGLG